MDRLVFDLQRFGYALFAQSLYGGNDTLKSSSSNSSVLAYGGNDSIYNDYSSVTIDAGTGDDTVTNSGNYSRIYGGTGNDYVNNRGDYSYISLGDGNDSIYSGDEDYSTIDGGAGEDVISGKYWGSSINGGAGNDVISVLGGGYNNIVKGGTGNDSIYSNNSYGIKYQYAQGDGYDYIGNFKSSDTVSIAGSAQYTRSTVGSNVVVSMLSGGAMTLGGAANLSSINITGGTFVNVIKNAAGTGGDDYIYNDNIYIYTIKAWAGNDTIVNYAADNVSIDGGYGNDIISLSSGNSSWGWNASVKGGPGNDTIYSNSLMGSGHGANYQYASGDGYDVIYNWNSNDKISIGGSAEYSRSTVGSDVVISLSNGAITVKGAIGKTVSVVGGKEVQPFNVITNSNSNSLVSGASLNDAISNSGSYVTINSWSGNDSIYSQYRVTVDGGLGNDTINVNSGSIVGNEGDDLISIFSSYSGSNLTTINGGKGNDTIYSATNGHVYQYAAGDGYDLICNWNENDTLTITGGTWTTSESGSDIIVSVVGSAGSGNMTLVGAKGKSLKIYPVGIIDNTASYTLISSGDEANTIKNSGSNVTINAGAGNDSIRNDGDNVIIDGGYGSDTIYNHYVDKVSVIGGTSNDSINNFSAWYSTINAGDGNDTVVVSGRAWKDLINGGAGADKISLGSSIDANNGNNTIIGGAGNDTIWGNPNATVGNVYQYNAGDGYDSILNFRANDTVSLGSSAYYSLSTVGSDVVISLSSGAMTLKGAASLSGVNLIGGIINNSANTVTLSGNSNDNIIRNSGSYVTIRGWAGNDSIYSQYRATIDGGLGNDTINVNSGSIAGGDGNDLISLTGSLSESVVTTINGGTGNDTIYGSTNGHIYQYASGDGNDVIYNWNNKDSLTITGGSWSTSESGDDVIVSVAGSGKMTLVGAKGKTLNIYPSVAPVITKNYTKNSMVSGNSSNNTIANYAGGAKIYGYGGNDSIFNSTDANYTINGSYGYVTIDAGDGKDTIRSYDPNVSINAGANDDFIYLGNWANITVKGGTGNDTIQRESSNKGVLYQYAANDGNDLIYNWNDNDTLTITSSNNWTTTESGNNIIVSVEGSGKITLVGGKNKTLNIYPNNGKRINTTPNTTFKGDSHNNDMRNTGANVIIQGFDGNDTIYNTGANSSIFGGNDNDTIYNNVNNVTISGDSGKDTITNNGGKAVSIDGGSDNDSIHSKGDSVTVDGGNGTDTINNNSGAYVLINGGEGNDSIYSHSSYSTILGGAGADKISLTTSSANDNGRNTIIGGKGNDTIWGNPNAVVGNVYQYASGDGNDIIYNWNDNDTLTITGGTWTTSESGNDVIITVGDGKITLSGAKSKTLNIYPSGNPIPDTLVSAQDVIKTFMKAMDDATATSSRTILNNAIAAVSSLSGNSALSSIKNIDQAITEMANDLNLYNNNFLSYKCGIDLNNNDTGAITGSDAGGSSEKTASSVVKENGSLTTPPEKDWFEKRGLTVRLAKDSNGFSEISYNSLSNDSYSAQEQYIWKGLYSWWIDGALDLIAESYGNNFGFDSNSTATIKDIYVIFYNKEDNKIAETDWIAPVGNNKGKICLKFNMYYLRTINTESFDGDFKTGKSSRTTNQKLDRTIAHELTHAVMNANVKYATGDNGLPSFIKEGLAELTHGIDDKRKREINALTRDGNIISFLKPENVNETHGNVYAAGYIFLRWLAQKFSSAGGDFDIIDDIDYLPDVLLDSIKDGLLVIPDSYKEDTTINLSNHTGTVPVEHYGVWITLPAVSTVNAGEHTDNLYIIGNSLDNSIVGGTGDDEIFGGKGNDILTGGNGNDIMYGGSDNDSLNGGEGDDEIHGGEGNDTLTGGKGADIFIYEGGNDIITDYTAGEDTIEIWKGSITGSALSGSDVILQTKDGKITIKNGKGKKLTWVDVESNIYSSVIGGSTTSGKNITNSTANKTFSGGADDDTLTNWSGGKNSTINGWSGNDSIKNSAANVTINGGAGDDTITNSGANVLFNYANGDGNDSISGFNATSTLRIGNGTGTYSTIKSGDNVVVTVGEGKITLQGAASLSKLNIAGKVAAPNLNISNSNERKTLSGGAGDDTLTNWSGGKYSTINGWSGNDSIKNSAANVTINGGAGDDKITNSGANVLFNYANGDGNDSISGFNATSTLLIGNDTGTYSTIKSGDNVIVTVGDGKITLVGAAGLSKLNIFRTLTLTNNSSDKITLPDSYEVANASTRTKAIQIIGNNKDNWIVGGSGNDTLTGGAGDDSLEGGSGNDSLWGGAGNDTLFGDAGADKFIYNNGDGNDLIYGFDNTDMLQITDTWSAAYYSGSGKLIFKVGDTYSAIILDSPTASTFNINGTNYKISGSTLVRK